MKKVLDKPVVLITAVGAPPGINTVRFLNESAKYNIIATDADHFAPSLYQYQKDSVRSIILPKASQTKEYLKSLFKVIVAYNVKVIIPCIEEELEIIAKNRDEIEMLGAKVLLPSFEVLRIATNKATSTKIAKDNYIPSPQSVLIKSCYDEKIKSNIVRNFAHQCSPPWIIKPVYGHGMQGIVNASSIDETLAIVNSNATDQIVQEIIPGKIGSMFLVALLYNLNGEVVRRFSSRSIRTMYASGGPATAGISINIPKLIDKTEQLIECIGTWRGPAAVEWMLDPRDNTFKYIEINARIWGYSSLAAGAGANFHLDLAELTLNNELGPDPGFKEGVVMIRNYHDVIFPCCPFELTN